MSNYILSYIPKMPLTITALETNTGVTEVKIYNAIDTSEATTAVVDRFTI